MKYLQYIKLILIIIGVIAIGLAVGTGNSETEDYPFLSLALNVSYMMFFAAIAASILMPLVGIIQNPKGALKSLVGLGILAVVVLISYGMASEEVITMASGKVIDSAFVLKFTDTALYSTYFAFAGVIIAIVGSEFYRIFK